MLHVTEIFQCFLSAREVARSRDRDRMNSGAGSGARVDDPPPQSQQERRVSADLPRGSGRVHRCLQLCDPPLCPVNTRSKSCD